MCIGKDRQNSDCSDDSSAISSHDSFVLNSEEELTYPESNIAKNKS